MHGQRHIQQSRACLQFLRYDVKGLQRGRLILSLVGVWRTDVERKNMDGHKFRTLQVLPNQMLLIVYSLIWASLPGVGNCESPTNDVDTDSDSIPCSPNSIAILSAVACVGLVLIALSTVLAVWCLRRHSSTRRCSDALQMKPSQQSEELAMPIYSNADIEESQPGSLEVLVDNELYSPGTVDVGREEKPGVKSYGTEAINVYESVS